MTIEELKFDASGLIPVITQDVYTKEVLMLAYANKEAMEKTLQTGRVHYYSRSRQCLWLKGETSGHFQYVKHILYDCDQDAVLIQVQQEGAACHTGEKSCFYQALEGDLPAIETEFRILQELYETIEHRRDHIRPGSYTCYLFEKGIDKMLKKIGEEAAEVIIAAKNPEDEELRYEIADLFYHLLVVMVERGITLEEIIEELKQRRK